MKRSIFAITAIAIVFTFIFTLVQAPARVSAAAAEPAGVAEGSWNTGTEVEVDLTAHPAPAWLQLLGNGVELTAPAKICHPFRGGQFKWVGEIRQLVDGNWVKLETQSGWLNGTEGEYVACANAPAAGTYALFGYYTGPNETVAKYKECSFDYKGFDEDYGYIDFNEKAKTVQIGFDMKIDLPVGTNVRYKIISVDPVGGIDKGFTGSTSVILLKNHSLVAFFDKDDIHFTTKDIPTFWVRLEFPTLKCYKNLEFFHF